MKTTLKKVLAVVLFLSVLSINPGTADSAKRDPQIVRIGLYAKDDSSNPPVTSFSVSAEEGILLGTTVKNKFVELYDINNDDQITIRKDAFYTVSKGVFTEYNPKDNSKPKGEALGAYHVKLDDGFKNWKDVQKAVKKAKKNDVDAYAAYDGNEWYMWTGFYTNEEDAETAVKKDLKKKFKNMKVINPSSTRIAVFDDKGNVILLFDSKDSFFQVYPNEDNDPAVLKINGKPYRGAVEVRRYADSDMTVINVLSIEEYLYGVVPNEVEANCHEEALKAQAVTARTYTVNNLNKHSTYGYDLCTTTSCQVYKGFSTEHQRSNKAVDKTEGEIITYKGDPAKVFYFSSSGGRTEDVKNVWGSDIPYLKSVEDKYESGKSYNYNWEVSYTPDKLKQLMQSKGYDIGNIISVTAKKFSDAGRVTELEIKGTKGKPVVFKLESARTALNLHSQWYRISTDANVSVSGAEKMLSKTQLSGKTAITASGNKSIGSSQKGTVVLDKNGNKKVISTEPSVYKFTGKGWGHAVGLSQEGAKGMAEQGFTYEEILTHYFSGTKIEKI